MITPPRIGILGAPGTGKHDLAKALRDGLEDSTVIRLAYGDEVHGLVLGEGGTWRTSMVLYAELLAERHQLPDDWTYIEVGTCFDRMAHCGHRLKGLNDRLLDPTFSDTERHELIQLSQALPCLAIALVETWNYDYAFYLPVGEDASDFERGVDEALQELMESYLAAGTPLGILKLEGGSSSDRADTVLKVLQKFEPLRIEQLQSISEAERTLRDGDEDGLDRTDSEAAEGSE